jgi:hypothetical protein
LRGVGAAGPAVLLLNALLIAAAAISDNSTEIGDCSINRLFRSLSISAAKIWLYPRASDHLPTSAPMGLSLGSDASSSIFSPNSRRLSSAEIKRSRCIHGSKLWDL